MQTLKFSLTLFIACTLLASCNNYKQQKEQSTEVEGDFEYVALENFKYNQAAIQPGTEVEVLATLGGRPSKGDTVFYYQFMVRDKRTNDTIRILCPEITIDEPSETNNTTSTSPLAFNIEKGVTNAFYQLIDSSQNLLLNGENLSKMANGTDSVDMDHLMDPTNAKKMVVLDKNATAKQNSTFRTAVGILNFKQIPW
jgi:hypothetical protein